MRFKITEYFNPNDYIYEINADSIEEISDKIIKKNKIKHAKVNFKCYDGWYEYHITQSYSKLYPPTDVNPDKEINYYGKIEVIKEK
jgi:hypothetical protein